MTTTTPDHHAPQPAHPVTQALTIPLANQARLRIHPRPPYHAADRRAVVAGSALYVFVGPRTDLPPRTDGQVIVGGYVGKSDALNMRAHDSWTHWVTAQRAFAPTAMALLHTRALFPPDELSVTEARVAQRLATDMGNLALTNTHTSAETAASRLTTTALHDAVALGDTIAGHIWRLALNFHTNPWPAPAPNLREAAIRILQRAARLEHRALDLHELVIRLETNGYPSTGRTRWRSVRRDLAERERRTGAPRALAASHRGRVIFYATTLDWHQAVTGYDHAHPRPEREGR